MKRQQRIRMSKKASNKKWKIKPRQVATAVAAAVAVSAIVDFD